MSQACVVRKCNRASRGLCDCCMQHLCLQHLSEHNASLISQLNPLTDEINALGDRLKTINIKNIVGDCHRILEEWRMDCHQKIDRFVQQKCKELDRLVNEEVEKQRKQIAQIQLKVVDLIREQETTRQDIASLTTTIRQLGRNMGKIEQTRLMITTRSLVIEDSFIRVKEINEIDLSTLPPVCKTVHPSSESKTAMTSNDRFLLIHRKPNLCLIDQQMNTAKEVLWNHGDIHDMCWSSTLNQFIVIGGKHIFLVDEETMTIYSLHTVGERYWLSCTCSETFLFLLTNEFASSIMKFSLLCSIELITEWKCPSTCAQDEVIHHIVYNDGTLGVVIKNLSVKSLRMELRSTETFDCIWSLRFHGEYNQNIAFRCCLLTCDEWLVADYETKQLFHITKDGKLKMIIPYDTIPYRANLFANMLIVTSKGIVNFHKL